MSAPLEPTGQYRCETCGTVRDKSPVTDAVLTMLWCSKCHVMQTHHKIVDEPRKTAAPAATKKPEECECGRPAAFAVSITKIGGELVDRVVFCEVCWSSPVLQKPIRDLDLQPIPTIRIPAPGGKR